MIVFQIKGFRAARSPKLFVRFTWQRYNKKPNDRSGTNLYRRVVDDSRQHGDLSIWLSRHLFQYNLDGFSKRHVQDDHRRA